MAAAEPAGADTSSRAPAPGRHSGRIPDCNPTGGPDPVAAFAHAMAGFAPWEPAPHLAVAVSGGADSLALCLLADAWARARGGRVTALTVDHGLRPDSAAEAAQVNAWLARRGVDHVTLAWRQDRKPTSGIQAAARQARYRLLAGWCRGRGVLTLLLGHHWDDQIETVRMRRERGSGPAGLGGMAALTESADVRLARPLLACPRSRIETWLRRQGQDWIDDASNRDPRFRRAALRARPLSPGAAARLAASAAEHGRTRAGAERRAAAALADAVSMSPAGYALLAPARLPSAAGDRTLRAAALASLLRTIGGRAYAPSAELVAARLDGLLSGGPAATLAGCWIGALGPDRLLICREAGRTAPPVPLGTDAAAVRWDNRFGLRLCGMAADGNDGRGVGLSVGALGEAGWRQIAAAEPGLRDSRVPWRARLSLPALFQGEIVLAAPHLRFTKARAAEWRLEAKFRPPAPAAGAPFLPAAGAGLAGADPAIV